ncbi:hypothetical protein LshimejAT787_1100340 [Lyophyllum shimeji]|uniref:Uncharacterized protein n=1 Tax=Lyophyllum shimeji TaxID=47721 RepID=A0A9P3PUZ0_LYOSH|nr:hypothetical protein LshimejAT787_1100340 [Lyophyllum shimeji]
MGLHRYRDCVRVDPPSLIPGQYGGIYYLMFVTFAAFFAETYGFSPGIGGLAFLGLGVGFLGSHVCRSQVLRHVIQIPGG